MLKYILFILVFSVAETVTAQSSDMEEVVWNNYNGEVIEDAFEVAVKRYYKEDGKIVKIIFLDADSLPRKLNWRSLFYPYEFRYEYDKAGNFQKRTAYDVNGEVMDLDGYSHSAIIQYVYNDRNQLTERRTYNKAGELLEMGDNRDAIVRYNYNSIGKLSGSKAFDSNGQLLPTSYQYEYNDQDRLSREMILRNGKLDQEFRLFYDSLGQLSKYDHYKTGEKIAVREFGFRNGILISQQIWFRDWPKEKVTDRMLDFEIDGWKHTRKEKDYLFENYGTGEFNIQVNKKGKIVQAVPAERVVGSMEFTQEIYRYLRTIKLHKVKPTSKREVYGKFQIKILREFPTLKYLDFFERPAPYD